MIRAAVYSGMGTLREAYRAGPTINPLPCSDSETFEVTGKNPKLTKMKFLSQG